MTKTTSRPPEERLWLSFAALVVALLFAAAIRWMLEHPFGIHADEAYYINEAQTDIHILHGGGLHQLARWLIHGDSSRPPGYRLAALPLDFLFGYHAIALRLMTFGFFLASAWFIYMTTKRIAGVVAGAIAILAFCLSPEILEGSIFFSTEGLLFLAVSGSLYFFSQYWSDDPVPWSTCLGLGLMMGIGFYSKFTFAAIAGPVGILTVVIVLRKHGGLKRVLSLALAGILALLVAIPWWRANLRSAFAYASFSEKSWVRHSLGLHSFTTFLRWLGTVFVSLLGPAIGFLICLVAWLAFRRSFLRGERILKPLHRIALLACICGVLPIVVAQLYGTNYNLRLISPVMIPVAISLGVLSGAIGWGSSRKPMLATGLLFSAQLVMLVLPILLPNRNLEDTGSFNGLPWRVMIRFEQWDWKPLRDLSDSCGIPTPSTSYLGQGRSFNGQFEYGWTNPIGRPRISYLGNGRAFNGSQIQYPWIAQGVPPPDVTWLWREEEGKIDWKHVLQVADQSDVVITAPQYVGQPTDHQDLDNQYNAEFEKRMDQDSLFQGPIPLEMGQFAPVEVDVFIKKTFVCHQAPAGPRTVPKHPAMKPPALVFPHGLG
jgi:4-amino-4-deoxy-L-arabinose transferase-like glycosyltransferase